MKMKIGTLTAAAAAALWMGQGPVGASATAGKMAAHKASLSQRDKTFMRAAALGGMAEVKTGQIAAGHGHHPGVKKFGQRMVTDHSKANDQLRKLAAAKGVSLPTGPGAKDEAMADRLAKLSGAAFDRAYMKDMVEDHVKDVSDFRKEAAMGSDPDLRQWVRATLPTLQAHLRMARATRSHLSHR